MSSLNLCDIPSEMIRLIAERADTRTRCSLRKCCKNYRKLVDDSKHVCKVIRVTLDVYQKISIAPDNSCLITYKSSHDGCEVTRHKSRGDPPESKVFLPGQDYLETAMSDLMTILRNRRLILKNLSIRSNLGFNSEHTGPFIKAFHDKLNTLNHQLHVIKGKLWRFSEDEMMQVLPFYQPAKLKIVKVALKTKERGRLQQIVSLEQWKQAEELVSTVIEPLKEVLHFKKVTVHRQFYHIDFYDIAWADFKCFFEKVISQTETSPLELRGHLLEVDYKLAELPINCQDLPARRLEEERKLLKVLDDGSRILLVKRAGYLGIHKYANGQDTSY